jgi:hypothetical protein
MIKLVKASDEVKILQAKLPLLEKQVKESETSLESLIEERRFDRLLGFGTGVIVASGLAIVVHLFLK